jgi:hypothetical protein
MPYQVKAGSVAAIVANEKQALEMLQRLGVDRGEVSIGDVFGEVVNVATLRSQINDANTVRLFGRPPQSSTATVHFGLASLQF